MAKLTDNTKKNLNNEKYDIDYILYGKIKPSKYEDPFDDIDSIVRHIDFNRVKLNSKNIFDVEGNDKYENYSKNFDNLFNKDYPLEIKKKEEEIEGLNSFIEKLTNENLKIKEDNNKEDNKIEDNKIEEGKIEDNKKEETKEKDIILKIELPEAKKNYVNEDTMIKNGIEIVKIPLEQQMKLKEKRELEEKKKKELEEKKKKKEEEKREKKEFLLKNKENEIYQKHYNQNTNNNKYKREKEREYYTNRNNYSKKYSNTFYPRNKYNNYNDNYEDSFEDDEDSYEDGYDSYDSYDDGYRKGYHNKYNDRGGRRFYNDDRYEDNNFQRKTRTIIVERGRPNFRIKRRGPRGRRGYH